MENLHGVWRYLSKKSKVSFPLEILYLFSSIAKYITAITPVIGKENVNQLKMIHGIVSLVKYLVFQLRNSHMNTCNSTSNITFTFAFVLWFRKRPPFFALKPTPLSGLPLRSKEQRT